MNTPRVLLVVTLLFAAGCQQKSKDELEIKKNQLTEYQKEMNDLESKIKALEREISQEDPKFAKSLNTFTLVNTIPVTQKIFAHQIEVRGIVESRKNVMIGSEAMGRVLSIPVHEGDKVKKGQIVLTIDAEVLKNNIDELNTSIDLAKVIYERQSNLWENKIGTEIQYLQAKNNYESLVNKLATVQTQLDKSTIRAQFSGSIDQILVKEGEMAQMGMPLVRIVSLDDMYLKADVSENYIGHFKAGDIVQVNFPALQKEFQSKITAQGQVIDPHNRTFTIEVKLADPGLVIKPNLTAIISLTDYVNPEAIIIPTEIIQKDNRGDYVYIIEEGTEGKIARRVHIQRGKSYQTESEVLSGLKGDELVINKGFREVTDGVLVTVVNEN